MKKKRYASMNTNAASLMVDDHFKMGGKMYRISSINVAGSLGRRITFYPLDEEKFDVYRVMEVLNTDPFKIYNQKPPRWNNQ